MEFELKLEDALMIVVQAFFNRCASSNVKIADFIAYAAQVCTEVQMQEVGSKIIVEKNGFLSANQYKLKFSHGLIHGIELKKIAVQICFVTQANFKDVCHKCFAFDKEKYADLMQTYKRIEQLQKNATVLQTQLADLTFNVMSADQIRYHSLKARNKTIEQAKRTARRNERQIFRET